MTTPLAKEYREWQKKGLKLDLTRGKPSAEQLELSMPLLDDRTYLSRDRIDCRNYGHLEGLPEAREFFAAYLDAEPDEVLVGGNSSLQLMHDFVLQALRRPLPAAQCAWAQIRGGPIVLCPVPGYDRHHTICERYGIGMLTVPMTPLGPDMDFVEQTVRGNPRIVGMWCTPVYSNPTGTTYSPETVRRIARMRTAWPRFTAVWDLAYKVHHLTDIEEATLSLAELTDEERQRFFAFGSTSKITFPGAGVSAVASTRRNIEWLRSGWFSQTIGADKLNQLRHVRFLRDMPTLRAHMRQHAHILRLKFAQVEAILAEEFGERSSIVSWRMPRGGYFVTLQLRNKGAGKVVRLAAEAGVLLTPAGATHPRGYDWSDSYLRIAPTFPPINELRDAMRVVALCIKLVA